MVDILALAVSHGLLALAALRLLWRDDLDAEGPAARRQVRPRGMRVRVSDEAAAPAGDSGAGLTDA